jgi:protein-disulfide isomerase
MRPVIALLACAMLTAAAEPRHVEGNRRSAVRVVIYEDFACSDCANFRAVMDETLLPRFAGTVAFEHRDFPLPKHVWARRAAIAARHFERVNGELSVAWRRFAMKHLREITDTNFNEYLERFARDQKADASAAVKALADAALAAAVEQDYQEGIARGVSRTPTVLVNDTPFIERFPVEEIVNAIAAAVKESGQ